MGPARLTGLSSRLRTAGAISLLLAAGGCGQRTPSLILGATTSTYDSGLLEVLVREFRADHPAARVRTIVVGSGEALELARRGDADVLIVHAPVAEARFVAAGHAARREPLMSNEFVIAGPASDPARVRDAADPADGFRRIAASGVGFISRGDSSGTHERELALWRDALTTPARPWYVESGQGQATTLQIASERQAYVLTDRATFDVLADITDLVPLSGNHPALLNPYSVIVPANAALPEEARALADWLVSDAATTVIDGFRLPNSSGPLFRPTDRAATSESGAPPSADAPAATEDSVVSSVTSAGERQRA